MTDLASAIDPVSRAAIDRARAAWPAFAVDDATMHAAIIRSLEDSDDVTRLFVDDLYLAQGCATAAPAALAAFDELLATVVQSSMGSMGLGHDAIADVLQEVRARVLVASDEPAKIARYSARAPLRSWIRTVATRVAIDRIRRLAPATIADDDLVEASATVDSPELELFRRKYAAEFKQAFEAAVATLDVRERNCLRHYFVDGLTTEEIGALYGVHKTTAFRWIEAARDVIAKRTRNNFQRLVQLSPSEIDSIVHLLRSQIDLSLSRNLNA